MVISKEKQENFVVYLRLNAVLFFRVSELIFEKGPENCAWTVVTTASAGDLLHRALHLGLSIMSVDVGRPDINTDDPNNGFSPRYKVY
jgi:hypothetical protein